MMKSLVVCVTVLLAVSQVSAKNWALLIAGSKTYDNYRHQADVCHAYQTMHKVGIPDENMVVMMYDDIANNKKNPFKGNIINQPHGPNVYEGVLKDYTGKDVNVDTFLAVLQGDKEGVKRLTGKEGKVIESGPDDYVFVYFADHGAAGLLMMPDLPYLKATALNSALKSMHTKKKFAKLLFYTEACDSGSIFKGLLPKNINVFATTATNVDEPSWSQDYDNKRKASINDEYSAIWLEDTDKVDLSKETIAQQYQKVKKKADGQHPMEFGDMSIAAMTLDKFFGNNAKNEKPKKIECPGGSLSCPNKNTCCPTKKENAGYWCCPSANATCCDDGISCCDHGWTCDKDQPTCSKGYLTYPRKINYPQTDSQIKSIRLQEAIDLKVISESKVHHLHDIITMKVEEKKPKKIECPGGSLSCPNKNTCCKTKSDENAGYWCCPAANATCCDDGISCCDHGWTCDKDQPTCSKGYLTYPRKMNYPQKRSRSENDRVKVHVAKQRIIYAESSEEKLSAMKELADLEKQMVQTQDLIFDVAKNVYSHFSTRDVYEKVVKTHEDIKNFDCYYGVLDTLMGFCPAMDITKNDFAARELYILVNLCNHNTAETIIEAASVASAKSPLCHF